MQEPVTPRLLGVFVAALPFWPGALFPLSGILAAYCLGLVAGSVVPARGLSWRSVLALPVVFATLHVPSCPPMPTRTPTL